MEPSQEEQTEDAQVRESSARSLFGELIEFRTRARRLLHAQRERVRYVEVTVGAQIQLLFAELQQERAAAVEREFALQQRLEQSEPSGSTDCDSHDEGHAEARAESQAELERCRSELQARIDEVGELRRQLDERTAEGSPSDEAVYEELERLQAERDDLQARLSDAESRSEDPAPAGEPTEMDDLRDRCEMAVQEVRELKAKNAELSDRATAAVDFDSGVVSGFDWESQKKQLLAQLESDFDEDEEEQKRDKLTVEGAIRITDQVVAEKDREIAELKRLLEEQSSSLGSVAVGAAAIAESLDNDELIRDERENLQRLQDEWREKLRQAEVEISVERAKIARERTELEEKLRAAEAERAQDAASNGNSGDKSKTKTGGRWLARLGLKEDGT